MGEGGEETTKIETMKKNMYTGRRITVMKIISCLFWECKKIELFLYP